jgi:hypothetical protein
VCAGSEVIALVSSVEEAIRISQEQCAKRGRLIRVKQLSPATVYEAVPEELDGTAL